jgi:hypothetical protein
VNALAKTDSVLDKGWSAKHFLTLTSVSPVW